jgi:hypothetical protein
MQFINSFVSLLKNKKLLLVVFALVGCGIILFFTLGPKGEDSVDKNEYYDPGSGETVSDPEGKEPERFNVVGKQLVYLGFSKLLDVGASKYHVEAAKNAFGLYSESRGSDIKEVSIFVSSIKRITPDREEADQTKRITFDVLLNRSEQYQAILENTDTVSAQLVLQKDGSVVYRSGFIDPTEEEGDIYLDPADR